MRFKSLITLQLFEIDIVFEPYSTLFRQQKSKEYYDANQVDEDLYDIGDFRIPTFNFIVRKLLLLVIATRDSRTTGRLVCRVLDIGHSDTISPRLTRYTSTLWELFLPL